MADIPTGTVTFLFTDIEGSTRLWEKFPEGMKTALARHDEILREAIEAHVGYVFKTVGDAFCAAFPTASDALEATLEAQRSLSAEQWGETGPLKVRASLHTGAAEERGGDYFGPPVNRVARLLSSGHGGQVILSQPTYDLVRDDLPEGTSLSDMGEHRLKDLVRPEHVFQLVSPDLPADFSPLKTLDTRPNNLPAQPTALIGREKELDEIGKLLLRDDVRLVTLNGPGGTGKTRLGLQVGADMIEDFNDGVFFVPLAPVTDTELVPTTIAHILGLQESGGQPILESLKSYLKNKEILLILDNFEQIVSAAAYVADILSTSPKLKMLVTSRETLHLRGEKEYQVPPLSLPDPEKLAVAEADFVSALSQYEAVRLFIQRALDVKADFEVTIENAPALAEICHRLDGLPLAIELAAVRIKLLTPQAILKRLSSQMKLLTGGARDLPERQQTIRGAIAWSHDLLEEGEKMLFRRLSVFVGGCSLEAAEEFCNADGALEIDILDGVASLVDKSLLRQEEASSLELEGEPRFVMMNTIREYGLEQLEESGEEDMKRNHANFFLSLVKEAEPELHGPDQVKWLDRFEIEHDNLRAALEWSLGSGEAEVGLRLVGPLYTFWLIRGYNSEGREWFRRALSQSSDGSDSARAKAFYGAGGLAMSQGDLEQAVALGEKGLILSRQLEDKKLTSMILSDLGMALIELGETERGSIMREESLSLSRETEDKLTIINALLHSGGSGGLPALQHDYEKTRELYEETLALCREGGFKRGLAWSLFHLGIVAINQGDYHRALELLGESMTTFWELRDKFTIVNPLFGTGEVAKAQGRPDRAARLFGTAGFIQESIGVPLGGINYPGYERIVDAIGAELGEEAFEAAWAEGRAMTMEEAVAYALEPGPTSDDGAIRRL